MAPFARDLGHDGPPFAWDEDRRATLKAELDGWFAHAYGLTRDELRYVLDPADVMGPDYPSETFRVLKSNEEKRFGEYRTRRLVLAAYDDLATRRAETGLDAVDEALIGSQTAAESPSTSAFRSPIRTSRPRPRSKRPSSTQASAATRLR